MATQGRGRQYIDSGASSHYVPARMVKDGTATQFEARNAGRVATAGGQGLKITGTAIVAGHVVKVVEGLTDMVIGVLIGILAMSSRSVIG